MTSGSFQREVDLEDNYFKFITASLFQDLSCFHLSRWYYNPSAMVCMPAVTLKYQTNDKVRYHLGYTLFLLFSYNQDILPIYMAHMWIPWEMIVGGSVL